MTIKRTHLQSLFANIMFLLDVICPLVPFIWASPQAIQISIEKSPNLFSESQIEKNETTKNETGRLPSL